MNFFPSMAVVQTDRSNPIYYAEQCTKYLSTRTEEGWTELGHIMAQIYGRVVILNGMVHFPEPPMIAHGLPSQEAFRRALILEGVEYCVGNLAICNRVKEWIKQVRYQPSATLG